MIESYILEKPEELNEIEKLGDDFSIIIISSRWLRYYIFPSGIFRDTYNLYDNRNDYVTSCNSVVDAVKYFFNQLN